MMKVAAIDLGTNSFLCLIAEIESGKITKIYSDQVKVVRLGQGVNQTKRFHPDALQRARECLASFAAEIKKQNPDRVLAMATSAARDVTNSEELFKIGKDCGIPIQIIPGGKEAEITFSGATSALPRDGKNRLVIDVGGGSTEFILGRDHGLIESKSVDIGCVRLTEALITAQPTAEDELEVVIQTIKDRTKDIFSRLRANKIDEVIAVAGTPSAIAAIELGGFDANKVDGYLLSRQSLQQWVGKLAKLSVEEKMNLYNLERGRADVILVGTTILWVSLEQLNLQKLMVSTKGVRFGVALELAK